MLLNFEYKCECLSNNILRLKRIVYQTVDKRQISCLLFNL